MSTIRAFRFRINPDGRELWSSEDQSSFYAVYRSQRCVSCGDGTADERLIERRLYASVAPLNVSEAIRQEAAEVLALGREVWGELTVGTTYVVAPTAPPPPGDDETPAAQVAPAPPLPDGAWYRILVSGYDAREAKRGQLALLRYMDGGEYLAHVAKIGGPDSDDPGRVWLVVIDPPERPDGSPDIVLDVYEDVWDD